MDQHDIELLDKQTRAMLRSPRHDGVIILALVTMFLAGIALGGFVTSSEQSPQRAGEQAATTNADGTAQTAGPAATANSRRPIPPARS